MAFRSLNLKHLMARQACSLVVLAAFLLSCLPVPINRVVSNAISAPFPCQSCRCSCSGARQCWTKCCCFSPSQRVAWAKRNGVQPPAYAVLKESTGREEDADVNEPTGRSPKPAARLANQPPKSCCSNGQPSNKLCLAESSSETPGALQRPNAASEPMAFSEAGCQGRSSPFTLLPWAIVNRTALSAIRLEPLVTPNSIEDHLAESIWLPIDVPPPRVI